MSSRCPYIRMWFEPTANLIGARGIDPPSLPVPLVPKLSQTQPTMPPSPPAAYWILTIPQATWTPPLELPPTLLLIKGQLEEGASGFKHWQVVIRLKNKQRLSGVRLLFPRETHAEPTRSAAALNYVWKEDTAVPGTRFSLGTTTTPGVDWDLVKSQAVGGDFASIDAGIMLRCESCGGRMPWRMGTGWTLTPTPLTDL